MCGRVFCDCTLDGINLWGRVQFVDAIGSPDFKVRMVTLGADLKVQTITSPTQPNSCGKWQTVTAIGSPDFKVQMVTLGEDFSIQPETLSPGLGWPAN